MLTFPVALGYFGSAFFVLLAALDPNAMGLEHLTHAPHALARRRSTVHLQGWAKVRFPGFVKMR